jgi:hypothetical protein
MKWTEKERARLAYIVTQSLEQGNNVTQACLIASEIMERSYSSCSNQYHYSIKYCEDRYLKIYSELIGQESNRVYDVSALIAGDEIPVEVVYSDPFTIVAKADKLTFTVKISIK